MQLHNAGTVLAICLLHRRHAWRYFAAGSHLSRSHTAFADSFLGVYVVAIPCNMDMVLNWLVHLQGVLPPSWPSQHFWQHCLDLWPSF